LRRQIAAGESLPAGSSRIARLDPRSLPVRFVADDRLADGNLRMVEIDCERVLLMRTVRGVHMRFNLPLQAFLGVAVRLLPARGDNRDAVAIVLEHRDANLSVPLHVADETDHVIADWQMWGSVLRKKLLVAESDGTLREPFSTLGTIVIGRTAARRPRRSALRMRRPKIYKHRACRRALDDMQVHAGEREIIARN
jgi:hypothetical protein